MFISYVSMLNILNCYEGRLKYKQQHKFTIPQNIKRNKQKRKKKHFACPWELDLSVLCYEGQYPSKAIIHYVKQQIELNQC